MPYIIAVLLLLVLLLGITLYRGKDKLPAGDAPVIVQAGTLSRDQLAQRLRALSLTPAPTNLALGASCYKPESPPATITYVCSTCGAQTLYAIGGAGTPSSRAADYGLIRILQQELAACRKLAAEMPELKLELDEAQLCEKCSPGVVKPQLVLVVRYADQREPHRVAGVTADDLRLIHELLAGKTKHVGPADFESALKEKLPRLRELLGVKQ